MCLFFTSPPLPQALKGDYTLQNRGNIKPVPGIRSMVGCYLFIYFFNAASAKRGKKKSHIV